MKNLHFKTIFQKTAHGKTIMMTVLPDDFICEGLPNIYEAQAVLVAPTIYSGTYPTIKIIPESIIDRKDLTGLGIEGIATREQWYNQIQVQDDPMSISIHKEPSKTMSNLTRKQSV